MIYELKKYNTRNDNEKKKIIQKINNKFLRLILILSH